MGEETKAEEDKVWQWHYNRVHFLKVYLSVFWNMKVYFIKYT